MDDRDPSLEPSSVLLKACRVGRKFSERLELGIEPMGFDMRHGYLLLVLRIYFT